MNKKTYIITEAELAFFLAKTEIEPNSFSPAAFDKIRSEEQEYPGTLVSKGLLATRDGKDFFYTPDGEKLVRALLTPQSAVEIEKKSEKACFYVFTYGGAYILFNVISDGRCVAVIFEDVTFLEDVLDKCFADDVTFGGDTFSVHFTFDEWYMFLTTQFYYMQLQATLKRTLTEEEMWIDTDKLDLPEIRKALAQTSADGGVAVDRLANAADRKDVCRSLDKKGIFETDTSDGSLSIRYTKEAITWLDNDKAAELLSVTSLKPGKSRRVMFTIRHGGVVMLEEYGNGVSINASGKINWIEFL